MAVARKELEKMQEEVLTHQQETEDAHLRDDMWISDPQPSLWQRLGERFLCQTARLLAEEQRANLSKFGVATRD